MDVYPNPSSGKFTISSSNSINSIEIINAFGELVLSDYRANKQSSYEFDFSAQPKGIYFIKLQIGSKIQIGKIIIK